MSWDQSEICFQMVTFKEGNQKTQIRRVIKKRLGGSWRILLKIYHGNLLDENNRLIIRESRSRLGGCSLVTEFLIS